MIKINLLPFRAARKRENIKRQITVYALTIALLFVVMAYDFLQKRGELSDLKQEEKNIKTELAKYKKTIKRINYLTRRIRDLKRKLAVIRRLEKGKKGPVHMLDEVAMAIPKDKLWLNSMSESKGTLTLRGMAKDNDTVALFMTNLERSRYLRNVNLRTTKLKRLKGRNLSSFTLNCKVSASKSKLKKPKTKKGKK